MMRIISPTLLCCAGLNLIGCGGTSVRIHPEKANSKDSFSATVEWNILKDLEDDKLKIIKKTKGDRMSTSDIEFELPIDIVRMMVDLANPLLLPQPGVDKLRRPRNIKLESLSRPADELSGLTMFERFEIFENFCWNIYIFIYKEDLKEPGLDWLKPFHRTTVDSKLLKFTLNFSEDLGGAYMRWYVRQCPQEQGTYEAVGQIFYI